jgi:hypothetical protein
VVYATGRFGPLDLPPWMPTVFHRTEIGVRLEFPSSYVPERYSGLHDPKDRWGEARTFCYCREGEVVRTTWERPDESVVRSVSGHSDGPPTGRTNHGLTLRLRVPGTNVVGLQHATCPLAEWLERPLWGFDALVPAIRSYLAHAKIPIDVVTLHGPCIEGVGAYPLVNPTTLAVPNYNGLFVIGDASGLFRGIVPALVSAACVAQQLADRFQAKRNEDV